MPTSPTCRGSPARDYSEPQAALACAFALTQHGCYSALGEGAKNVSFDCNSGGWHLRGWRLKHPLQIGCHVQKLPVVGRTTGGMGPMDVLHHSLRTVKARLRAVHCVAFLANSMAIGCKKTLCGPSRPALSPPREGDAGHPKQAAEIPPGNSKNCVPYGQFPPGGAQKSSLQALL